MAIGMPQRDLTFPRQLPVSVDYLETGLLQSGHLRVIGEVVDDVVPLGEDRSCVR